MCNVIDSRHSANGAPCRGEIGRDLRHRGEALSGQLYQTGKETVLCRLDVDADREERVHEMHPSVPVNAY